MGMAEQLLMGAAAGMAREGFIPFVTTYAVFATRRAYDFICLAIAEEMLPVKIVCALPGLTTGYGPSHQATEDIAIFRGMPNLTIIDPCDALEIEQACRAIADHPGPVYMRLLRGNVPLVLDEYDYKFELGKAALLRDGEDALVISRPHDNARAGGRGVASAASRVVAVLHARRSSRSTRRRFFAEAGRKGDRSLSRRTIPSSAASAKPSLGLLMRNRRNPISPDRAARRVPGRRRVADAARPLRALRQRLAELRRFAS
jgi:transketolase